MANNDTTDALALRAAMKDKGAVSLPSGAPTFVQLWHLSKLGSSPLLGMFERPHGYRALCCKARPARFVIYSDRFVHDYRVGA